MGFFLSSRVPFRSRVTVSLAILSVTGSKVRAFSVSPTASNVMGARTLGGTDLVVSEACLGTMTFGVQNNQKEAFTQLDYALSKGVNFIDTAELYPVPMSSPQWRPGTTELIVGNYLKHIGSSERDRLVVATKITGYFPNSRVAENRYNPPPVNSIDGRLDAASVRDACVASLRRLQTDRIDLYQIHWPDRYIPIFGQTEYDHSKRRHDAVPIEETAATLKDLIEEGKIRYIGISNETPFGVCQWVQACEKLGIRDKLATIQNSYNLVDRRFDGDLAEVCEEFNIGLLPWSVLAGGLLSGKYRSSAPTPPSSDSRFLKFPEYMSRWSPVSATEYTLSAVEDYAAIAEQAGMTPAELAISFVRSRHFVSKAGSTIIGATSLNQLKQNLSPFDKPLEMLDADVLEAINKVHMRCRDPCCSL